MQDWNVLAPSSHSDHFAREHLPAHTEWPVFQADLPELQYPAILNCGGELVDRHVAEGRGDRIAIRGMAPGPAGPQEIAWTYAELSAHCHRIAQVLTQDMGLVPGNRLLLRGANTPMMAACFLAALQAGLVVVPTMPMLRATELATIIAKAQVSAALCDAALLEELQFCQTPGHAQYQPLLQQVLAFRSEA